MQTWNLGCPWGFQSCQAKIRSKPINFGSRLVWGKKIVPKFGFLRILPTFWLKIVVYPYFGMPIFWPGKFWLPTKACRRSHLPCRSRIKWKIHLVSGESEMYFLLPLLLTVSIHYILEKKTNLLVFYSAPYSPLLYFLRTKAWVLDAISTTIARYFNLGIPPQRRITESMNFIVDCIYSTQNGVILQNQWTLLCILLKMAWYYRVNNELYAVLYIIIDYCFS